MTLLKEFVENKTDAFYLMPLDRPLFGGDRPKVLAQEVFRYACYYVAANKIKVLWPSDTLRRHKATDRPPLMVHNPAHVEGHEYPMFYFQVSGESVITSERLIKEAMEKWLGYEISLYVLGGFTPRLVLEHWLRKLEKL